MAQIFPIDFDEKLTIAQNDFILFSDSEDGNKIKKAQYSNLKGEKGDPGDPGTAATITVGSTTTGTPGSSASVVNSGTTSAAVLDFTIPEGEKGDPGDTGASVTSAAFNGNNIDFGLSDGTTVTLEDAKIDLKGDTGDAATISVGTTTTGEPGTNASVTNSGTTSAAVFNFTIPKGDKGDTGDPGSAATISVGTTTTGDAGTSASVTNSGTSSAAVFNFTIPKGDKGDTGDPGADGQDGADGAAATITVGSTTTGNPGTSASVVNSGTSSAAVFDFTIPQGATGATGNGIASVTSSKSGKITTVTITETDGDSSSFQISDGADGQGAGDVLGPNSSTDGNVVLFDGVTGKLIKDSGKAFTAAGIGALADSTKYGKTLDLSIDSTTYIVTATLKDQDGTTLSTDTIDLPLESVVVGGSYDSVNKKVVLTLENGNTVEFSVADLVAGLQSEITSSNKLDSDLVDDSTSTNKFVTASDKTTWNGKQDALIAGTNITIAADGKTISSTDTTYSAATSSTLGLVKLGDDTVQSVAANAVSGTASRTYAIQTNASDQLVVNVPWTDSVTSVNGNTGAVTVSEFNPGGTATTGYVLKKTADGYGWDAAPDVSNVKAFYLASTSDLTNAQAAYDWMQDGKEAILIYNGTAYIRDNAGGDIVFRSSSKYVVAGNSYNGAEYYMLQFTKSGSTITAIIASNYTSNYLEAGKDYTTPYTPTYNGSPATKKYVDDNVAYVGSSAPSSPTEGKLWYDTTNDVLKVYNGSSWDGVGGGLPTGGTEGQILMIVSGTPTWVTPTAKGFKMLSPNSPLTVPYDWYGTEAQYSSATKSNDTEYRTV